MLALMLYAASEQRQRAAQQAQENALRLARLAAADHEKLVDGARYLLIALAQLPAVRNHDPVACHAFTANLLAQYTPYANFGAVDREGNIWCMGLTQHVAVNVADRSYFRTAVQTRSFSTSEYQVTRAHSNLAITFGYPVLDDDAQVIGIVFAGLDLRWVNQFVTRAALPQGATLCVIDRNGTVLVHYPESSKYIGRTWSEEAIARTILAERAGVAEGVDLNGISRLYAFAPLSEDRPEVFLAIGLVKQLAFADADWELKRNLLVLGAAALVAFVGTWFGGNWFILDRIHALLHATRRLSGGDLSARSGDAGSGELGQLARAFDELAEALERRNAEQAAQAMANAQMHVRIEEEGRARASLLRKIITAQEDERHRIARELHDETAQGLTLLMMELDLGRRAQALDPLAADRHYLKSKAIADETLANLRRIIADMRPSILDDLGLVPAIAWYGKKRLTPQGIALHLEGDALERRLPSAIETALFRIAQEAISNAAKYSEASCVTVTLEGLNGQLMMQVQDDGKGFERGCSGATPVDERGMGLPGIRERVTLLGGAFDLNTSPGQGTCITVRIPVREEKADGDI